MDDINILKLYVEEERKENKRKKEKEGQSIGIIAKKLNSVASTLPKRLAGWAGQSACCIYRPPPWFVKAHNSYYEPEIISIGPFYHHYKSFKMMEEQKGKYLKALLDRDTSSMTMNDLVKKMFPQVEEARKYYSKDFSKIFDNETFIQMLILDGCFIIELFRRASGVVLPVDPDDKDPIFSIFHIFQSILKDLIKMGNQVPWFILEKLFVITNRTNGNPSLSSMALSTFNIALNYDSNKQIQELQINLIVKDPKHILDFLRQSLIITHDNTTTTTTLDIINYEGGPTSSSSSSVNGIQSISQLRKAGISMKPVQSCNFLDVKFNHNGTLEMSPLTMIDNFVSCLLFNGMSFEQCHAPSTKHFSSYVLFLDCLVNTREDVKYLTDHKIIQKYTGTENEVARLLNNMGKGLKITEEACYLSRVFDEVNTYQQNIWHKQITNLYTRYFYSPWAFISFAAASFFLILTILQTIFTIKH